MAKGIIKVTGILTGTSKDIFGTNLNLQQLESIQKQLSKPEYSYLTLQHNLSKPPIGKIVSTEIVKFGEGDYRLRGKIEVYDHMAVEKIKEWLASGKGGFSYSASAENFFTGKNGILVVGFDDQHFKKEEIEVFLSEFSESERKHLVIKPWRQRAFGVESLVIIIVPSAIAFGFAFSKKLGERLGEFTADEIISVYNTVKKKLWKFLRKRRKKTKIIISIKTKICIDLHINYTPEKEQELEKADKDNFLDEIMNGFRPPVKFAAIQKMAFSWESNWIPTYLISTKGVYAFENGSWIKRY